MAIVAISERRTNADVVFDHLYDEIISLGLLPGTKMSEAEVADQFGLSRQPVRDAFNRLGNMGLLRIQPQRATLVQKFSLVSIETARFVRMAIELELARSAIQHWNDARVEGFSKNLSDQQDAVNEGNTRLFHSLDASFHKLIAEAALKPAAFDLVAEKKAMVDRICVLSLKQSHEMEELLADHCSIFASFQTGDVAAALDCIRKHMSRIDKTIAAVHRNHPDFFE